MTRRRLATFLALLLLVGLLPARAADLSKAVVVAPANLAGPEKKAVDMLVDEVHKRTAIRWSVTETWPKGDEPVVAINPRWLLAAFAGQFADEVAKEPSDKAEGFSIRGAGSRVIISG